MRSFLAILLLIGAQWAAPALAQQTPPQSQPAVTQEPAPETAAPPSAPPQPKSLDQLLEMVREGFDAERAANQRREEEFKRNKQDQERLLEEALAKLAGDEATSQRLEVRYNENEVAIGTAQERMTERLGELGELFGVVRQVATDLGAQTWDSMKRDRKSVV